MIYLYFMEVKAMVKKIFKVFFSLLLIFIIVMAVLFFSGQLVVKMREPYFDALDIECDFGDFTSGRFTKLYHEHFYFAGFGIKALEKDDIF